MIFSGEAEIEESLGALGTENKKGSALKARATKRNRLTFSISALEPRIQRLLVGWGLSLGLRPCSWRV
jgi:hypothetical protein